MSKDDKMDVTYIDINFDVEKTFGKKRLKVKVWYDNVLYRGLLTKYKSVYHLIINKEIRAQLGKNAGDTIHVKIEEDLDERNVELPQVMIDFFRKEKELKAVFDKMSLFEDILLIYPDMMKLKNNNNNLTSFNIFVFAFCFQKKKKKN